MSRQSVLLRRPVLQRVIASRALRQLPTRDPAEVFTACREVSLDEVYNTATFTGLDNIPASSQLGGASLPHRSSSRKLGTEREHPLKA